MSRGTFWLLAVLLTGCSSKNLPDIFTLGSLRVLALQSNPAEVNPTSGAVNVTIQPVVSDLDGAQTTLSYTLQSCIDPGVSLGATVTCAGDPTAPATKTGTLTVTAPTYTGPTAETLSVSVPPTVFTGQSAVSQYNGVSYLVILKVTSPNGESTTAISRLIATTRTPVNTNPTITAIQANGANISQLPTVATELTPVTGATNAETYNVMQSDGTLTSFTENITISWLIADGTLDFSHSLPGSQNFWTPPSTTTRPIFLYALVRDDRGGVGFLPGTVGP